MNYKKLFPTRNLRMALARATAFIPDRAMLQLQFRLRLGKKLDLANPTTYNEKLQWLKLYDRRPEYTRMVDKYAVRDYIREKLGEQYLIPLLGVWEKPEDIDFDALPSQFVLKTNHDSGGLCICRDSRTFDREAARKTLKKSLKNDYSLASREWPYHDIPRKIICEKLMKSADGALDLTDYKFYCFDGYVDCCMACTDRSSGHVHYYFFDRDWNVIRQYNMPDSIPPEDFTMPKPACMEEMFRMAEILSAGIPQTRIDLYVCEGRPYFGEITLFNAGGFDALLPEYPDRKWGSLIRLPQKD